MRAGASFVYFYLDTAKISHSTDSLQNVRRRLADTADWMDICPLNGRFW